MPRRVFITVAEISGDRNAAQFARELRQIEPDIVIEGLGGPAMREAGVIVHQDTVSRSAMGLRAFLRYTEVRKLLAWTKDHHRQTPPDLHVCVDSWTMNWHFARLAKEAGIPVLYYIAPQAWASRPGRVKQLRAYVDRLACILPFEEQWFGSRGVKATFVGHPLFDHMTAVTNPSREMNGQAPVIGLLPGSRRQVARANFPRLLDVAARIRHEFPAGQFLIPTTPNTDPAVRSELSRRGLSDGFTIAQDGFDQLVPKADLCLTVSGTAALHLAAYNVPMIVVYYGNWLLWNLVGRWMISARTYSLVNILSPAGKKIAPEFVPWNGPVDAVAACALDYLKHPEKLAEQRRRLAEMIQPLAAPGASRRVAELAMELMK